jgi:hypothetical protein
MDLLMVMVLGSIGFALIVFALVPFKFTFNKSVQPPIDNAIGINHGMVRRTDRKGAVPIRNQIQ